MHTLIRYARGAVLSFAALLPLAPALAQSAAVAPSGISVHFDAGLAKLVSHAVRAGQLDDETAAAIRAQPAAMAMVRKLQLKDLDALIAYLRADLKNPRLLASANAVDDELGRADGGKYTQVGAVVTRLLAEYVPPTFAAKLNVYFIFGGNADGFAFDDVADDVYVNLAMLTQASTDDLAELLAHELFHAVQTHVMKTPPRPAAGAALASTGPVWFNRFLYDLEQEATAELFTHRLAERPENAYSRRSMERIARNGKRMKSLFTLYETIGLRLQYAPPANEDQYDGIYGLMFYGNFDSTAYDMGWTMAHAIEKKDGKPAIFALLHVAPKRFVLRYDEITQADPALPKFSEEFLRAVRSMPD